MPPPNDDCRPVQSPFTVQQWPPPEQDGGLQPIEAPRFRSESANSTQFQSRYVGQPSPQQLQQQSSVSQTTTWNDQAFRSSATAVPSGRYVVAADGAATSMEEDSPAGMRHSNSAPDLHLMLQVRRLLRISASQQHATLAACQFNGIMACLVWLHGLSDYHQ